jgi:hypothetical protein
LPEQDKSIAMKNFYLLLLLSVCLAGLLRAQIPANEGGRVADQLPTFIEEKFKKEYPNITPTWHVDEKLYIAEFTDTNVFKGMRIAYDRNGRVVRRESEMENASYPASINDYYVKNYPGEKFKTWRSRDAKGIQRYCIKRDSDVLWFDNEGKYIDAQKKSEETAINK